MRITDPAFGDHIAGIVSHRAKTSEMEHAARHHIREHVDEDPVYYGKLSERIDEILDRLEERWEQIALELEGLIAEINAGRSDENQTGLDPTTELPFHSQMAEKVASSEPETAEQVVALTRDLVSEIRRIIGVVGFWDNPTRQDDLRRSSSEHSTAATCSPTRASTNSPSNSSTSPKPTSTGCHEHRNPCRSPRSTGVGGWRPHTRRCATGQP